MRLEFTFKQAYGKGRYYPTSKLAKGIVDVTGRKCLNLSELHKLRAAGFELNIINSGVAVEAI